MARLKLNKEEISTIQNLQQTNNDLLFQLGDVEVGLKNLNQKKQELLEAWDQFIQEDSSFGKTLSDKYGKGSLDLSKNEYITED